MATTLFLGGLFNVVDPVTGFMTLYMWSWIILTIFILVTQAGMYYRGWKPLEPLHGLYYARKNQSTVAFTFNALLVGDLVAERDAKCIFNYADGGHGEDYEIDIPDHKLLDLFPMFKKIQIWWNTKFFYYPTKYLDIPPTKAIIGRISHVNKDVEIARKLEGGKWDRSASVVCAGVPVDIVVDMDDWTIRKSPQHKAIVKSARDWNQLNPTDQIHSYQKYQDYLLQNKIVCPQGVNPSALIPWQRIDAAFPLDLDENEWAGKKWQKSKDDEDSEAGNLNRLAMWVFIGGLGLAALILLARVALTLAAK